MTAKHSSLHLRGLSSLTAARTEPAFPAGRALSLILGGIVALALSALLAARHIPLTNDDANYVAYFSSKDAFQAPSLWRWILQEPLWRVGSSTLGAVLGPFAAYRAVLFLSALGLFVAGRRLGAPLLLLAFFFILDQQLATYLYMLAIRQGVATTVFLVLLATPLGAIGACLVAALIHSAFLVLLPGVLIAQLITARHFRWAGVLAAGVAGIVAVTMLTGYLDGFLLSLDLGRRGTLYSRTAFLNVNFFLVASMQYGLVLWLARDVNDRLFILTISIVAAALVMMGVNGMFARVALSMDALVVIYLCKHYRRRGAQIAMLVFVATLLVGHYSTAKNAIATNASWAARWSLLLQDVIK